MFGEEIKSSKSANRPVFAYANNNSLSICESRVFWRANFKNTTRSSNFPALLATCITSAKFEGSLALIYDSEEI
jgi:hypothetical protein